MGLMEEVKKLRDLHLYDDIKAACSFMLTLCGGPSSSLTKWDQYQLLIYSGEAQFNSGESLKAETYYQDALAVRKGIKNEKPKSSDIVSETELRYRLYEVYKDLHQTKDGIAMLEGIASKSRTPTVNKALAKMYQESGMDRSAITCYKEVLRECPLAMDAIQGLLSLGVKSSEVLSLCLLGESRLASSEWFVSWVNGQAQMADHNYGNAIKTFTGMETTVLRGNAEILNLQGQAYFLNAQPVEARLAWQKARHADPLLVKNMDSMAFVLIEEKLSVEVEQLSTALLNSSPKAVETYVVGAMYCIHMKKYNRALSLSQKVLQMDPINYMGHLVKGLSLFLLNKSCDATAQFREVIRLDRHRWEGYKLLTDAYLHLGRIREAISLASSCCKFLGSTSRTYCLYGKCLSKDPANIEKAVVGVEQAKQFLEKALKLSSTNTAAVQYFAEILLQQKKYARGIELLRNTTKECYSAKLYKLLGDFYIQTNEKSEALHCYNVALRLDPTNQIVKDAAAAVARSSDGSLSYEGDVDMMVGGLNDSDIDSPEGLWT